MTFHDLGIASLDPADPAVLLEDDSQQRALAHRGGVLRVLGAPGTGKTTVALRLVVERVLGGAAPDSCVVVTPDRARAAALRDRLTAVLGAHGVAVSRPPARSVTSLAIALLRRRAGEIGAPQPWLLSGGDHDAILRELLAGHLAGEGRSPDWPERLLPLVGDSAFRTQLRELLMRVVASGLDATDLGFLGVAHDREEWVAAARVLREYEEVCALARPGGFDPATAVAAASSALEEEAASAPGQPVGLRLVVVDDAQDLDPGGVRLVRQVVRVSGADLVVAGDPDSSAQAFRGADPGLLGDAGFSAGACLVLDRSHRQPQELAVVTARVAQRIGAVVGVAHRSPDPVPRSVARAGEGTAPPAAVGSGSPPVTVAVARSVAEEARTVTASLRRAHVLGKIPWSEMAVITRSASAGKVIERFLNASGVPVDRPGGWRPLRDEPAAAALLALAGCCVSLARGAEGLTGEAASRLLLSPVGGVAPAGLRELRAAARTAARTVSGAATRPDGTLRESADDLLAAAITGQLCVVAEGAAGDRLHALAAAVSAGVAATCTDPASVADLPPRGEARDVLWAVWSALDLSDRWRAEALAGGAVGRRADRNLDAVVALFDAAESDALRFPGKGPSDFFEEMGRQEVAADRVVARSPRGAAVTLTTPAGALGREWAVVAVCGVQEGVWPNLRLRGGLLGAQAFSDVLFGRGTSPQAARAAVRHDELRLFHVAVGRASARLLVTAVRSDDLQPSSFLDLVEPAGSEGERAWADPPVAMSLPGMVAELRRDIVSADESTRFEAAHHLAHLAAHGVPGAAPTQWRQIRADSCRRDRREAGVPARLSPSHLDLLGRCQARWLFTASGGAPAAGAAAAIGTLVHEIAATVDNGDEAAMLEALATRWEELGLPATWSSRRDRDNACLMLSRLARHHRSAAAEGWHVEGQEVSRTATIGGAVLTGRIDRLERHQDSRTRVVDLKTGSTKPTRAEITRHAQLGAYQLLLHASDDSGRRGPEAPQAEGPVRPGGGAALLQLGSAAPATGTGLQSQAPLGDDEDPGWALTVVGQAAAAARGSRVRATPGPWCRTCPVSASCPVDQGGGES